ncbi:hypothetical protein PPACK8108_LOCUS5596 [Phakopsora pachyrhizi]|uniref:Uncharacterized protein n=1 Tax=Phakopsora pachyrhizi TaxID=170000 RepID=A0AAV0AQL4_PHAPC|nr:hypothetical protein PPACK8108_LOCUS5596 [Phakopsora pachyrhizi]
MDSTQRKKPKERNKGRKKKDPRAPQVVMPSINKRSQSAKSILDGLIHLRVASKVPSARRSKEIKSSSGSKPWRSGSFQHHWHSRSGYLRIGRQQWRIEQYENMSHTFIKIREIRTECQRPGTEVTGQS